MIVVTDINVFMVESQKGGVHVTNVLQKDFGFGLTFFHRKLLKARRQSEVLPGGRNQSIRRKPLTLEGRLLPCHMPISGIVPGFLHSEGELVWNTKKKCL